MQSLYSYRDKNKLWSKSRDGAEEYTNKTSRDDNLQVDIPSYISFQADMHGLHERYRAGCLLVSYSSISSLLHNLFLHLFVPFLYDCVARQERLYDRYSTANLVCTI